MRPKLRLRALILGLIFAALIGAAFLPALLIRRSLRGEREGRVLSTEASENLELSRYRFVWRGLQFGVPAGAYRKAVEQMRLMPHAHARNLALPDPSWTFVGPQPMLGEGPSPAGEEGGNLPPIPGATGRLTAIVADPTTPGRIFVGAATGGVWMSTDGGSSFLPIGDSLPTQAIGALAINPTTAPPTLYVGTGEGNNSDDSLYGQGIFVSSDLGVTWSEPAPGLFGLNGFTRLAIETSDSPAHLFAGVDAFVFSDSRGVVMPSEGSFQSEGLWRSTDGGTSWMQYPVATFGCSYTSGSTPCPAADVALDPSNRNNVYAAFLLTNPFAFRSTDGGGTWRQIGFPGVSTTAQMGRTTFAVGQPAPGAPVCSSGNPCGVVYAMVGAADLSSYAGFFRSTDGGVSWSSGVVPCEASDDGAFDGTATGAGSSCGTPSSDSQSLYDQALAVEPGDASASSVVFGGLGPYESTDSGQHWAFLEQNGGTHTDQHALAFDPFDHNRFFLGNDGGLYSFDLRSRAFTSLNSYLSAAQIYAIGLHPTAATSMVVGTQDNGNLIYSGSLGWNVPLGSDSTGALWDQIDPNYVYVHQLRTQIAASSDGGVTYALPGPTANLSAALAAAKDNPGRGFAVDPQVGKRVIFGGRFVYVSTDAMETWQQQTTQDLTGCGSNGGCALIDLEFAPSDHTRAWALSLNGGPSLYELSNTTQAECPDQPGCPAGVISAAWNSVTNDLPVDPTATQATGIAVDPNDSSRALLSLSGFTAATGFGHLFMTPDFGASWTRVDGAGGASPLPDIPVLRALIDRNDPTGNTIYAATEIGVFSSSDGGGTWSVLGTLPAVPVFDIAQNLNGTIAIGTHGRGAYELNVAAPPPFSPTPTATPSAAAPATPTPTSAATIAPTPSPVFPPGGRISVPPALKFGNVGTGLVSRPVMFLVKNVGRQFLNGEIDLGPLAGSPFSVTGRTTRLALPSGEFVPLVATFAPKSPGFFTRQIHVLSGDPVTPDVAITLSGTGIAPKLAAPTLINFGAVSVRGSKTITISIRNRGPGLLSGSLNTNPLNPPFTPSISNPAFGPVKDGKAFTFKVTFAPRAKQSFESQMLGQSNDPNHEFFAIMLEGTGR